MWYKIRTEEAKAITFRWFFSDKTRTGHDIDHIVQYSAVPNLAETRFPHLSTLARCLHRDSHRSSVQPQTQVCCLYCCRQQEPAVCTAADTEVFSGVMGVSTTDTNWHSSRIEQRNCHWNVRQFSHSIRDKCQFAHTGKERSPCGCRKALRREVRILIATNADFRTQTTT